MALRGLPWPKKIAGIGPDMFALYSRLILESRRRWFEWLIPGVSPNHFQLSFVDLITTRHEERIEFRTAEGKVRNATIGRRQNTLHSTCLISHLDSQSRSHVQTAIAINANAISVAAIGSIGYQQPVVALFVVECAVRLDDVGVHPVRAIVCDVEESLIRR